MSSSDAKVLLLLFVVGIVGFFAYIYRSVADSSAKADARPGGPAVSINLPTIDAEFDANEVAANLRYDSKLVTLSGAIGKIAQDGTPVLIVMGPDGPRGTMARCAMDASETNAVAQMKTGQSVNVECVFCSHGKSGVSLHRCLVRLLPAEAN